LPFTSCSPTKLVKPNTRNIKRLGNSNKIAPNINQSNIVKTKKLNPTWRKGNLIQNPEFIKFSGEVNLT
jgi:hypothetical protein